MPKSRKKGTQKRKDLEASWSAREDFRPTPDTTIKIAIIGGRANTRIKRKSEFDRENGCPKHPSDDIEGNEGQPSNPA